MKHIFFLVYVIASTAPELAAEIEIFSHRPPGLFYMLLFFFPKEPYPHVLGFNCPPQEHHCFVLQTWSFCTQVFTSLKFQICSTENCEEKHSELLLGFI